MELRPFGPRSARSRCSVKGPGTTRGTIAPPPSPRCARGIDLGMTHIDTAEMYLTGCRGIGRRGHRWAARRSLPGLQDPSAARLPQRHAAACEGSLARLETDRLDCYLLHWRGNYPLEETFAAFEQLRREGKSSPGA